VSGHSAAAGGELTAPGGRTYARRTGAERGFATAKDPATNDISRGWCRLMGLAPLTLFTVTLLIVRNQRILAAWNARQEDNARRAAGCPENPQAPPHHPAGPRRRAPVTRPRPPPSPGTEKAAACPHPPQPHSKSQHNARNKPPPHL
jgi:hypothetical protein